MAQEELNKISQRVIVTTKIFTWWNILIDLYPPSLESNGDKQSLNFQVRDLESREDPVEHVERELAKTQFELEQVLFFVSFVRLRTAG